MMSMPSSVVPVGTTGRPAPAAHALLDRDRLREVARLVDVRAPGDGRVVREQLERDHGQDRAQRLVRVGHPADVVGEALDLGSPSVATAMTRASRARPSITLQMSLS